MADNKKARKSNFSPEEVETLVNTVAKHYNILYGEFAKRAVNKHARHRVWLDVTKRVNRVSIERRTLQEVKNKWKKCQHLYREQDQLRFADDFVVPLPNVWEPLTTVKDKIIMKNKSKHRSNKNNKRLRIRRCSSYEPDFKKAVVLYAEQKSTGEAKRRYGISESNIRRWRRLRNDIMEKASQQPKFTRKSKFSRNAFEGSVDDFEFSSSLDSMPLEQRLSNKTPTEQEPVLQSQPLSPTKLKVTRQAAKPAQTSQKTPTPEPPNEEVCLRWNSHHSNMQNTFPNLLMREQYVDATLVAEGQTLKCHRLILSSCSPYFEDVLSGISPFQHPVLFMKDIPFWILKSLCDFMYAGEVHIFQNKLEELLAVAETLKIKGLAGKTGMGNEDTKAAEPVKEDKKMGLEKKEETRERKKHIPGKEADPQATRSKFVRSTHNSKRAMEKAQKEVVAKDEVSDPLDLLEPVYEELTTDSKRGNLPARFKDNRSYPAKKSLPKKLKKRKLSDEREESPPMFMSRRGTRSRPNVKIPKYYHTHYERAAKLEEASETTIVREPHTDQADPLMQVEEIKAEPLDLVDDVIEIEDNVVGYIDQDVPLQEEEIFGHYDSPIFTLQNKKNDDHTDPEETAFKKINLLPHIMDVHSMPGKSQDTLKIVDMAELRSPTVAAASESNDPLLPLQVPDVNSDSLEITNVATLAETTVSDDTSTLMGDITIANVESVCEMDTARTETIAKSGEILNIPAEDPIEASSDANIAITNVESVADGDELRHETFSEPAPNLDNNPETDENPAEVDDDQADLGSSENEATEIDPEEVEKQKNTSENMATEIALDNNSEAYPSTLPTEIELESIEDDTETDDNHCTENATDIERAAGDKGTLESDENTNALGFHIAKVASEQFMMDTDGRYTQSGDSPHKLPPDGALSGTVVNDSETREESQKGVGAPDVIDSVNDESEMLAKSLEALLDK